MQSLIPFTLFGSGIAFGIFIVLFFISLVICDIVEETPWSSIVILISFFLILNYFAGNVPIMSYLTWKNIGLYISIGFIFALIRTYFKGKELNTSSKKSFDLKSNFFRWWFLFPISAVSWIFGRLLKDLWNWLYNKISTVVLYIFNA